MYQIHLHLLNIYMKYNFYLDEAALFPCSVRLFPDSALLDVIRYNQRPLIYRSVSLRATAISSLMSDVGSAVMSEEENCTVQYVRPHEPFAFLTGYERS